MSCYHPMEAIPIGKTASGKTDYKITGKFQGVKSRFNAVVVPCGQCIGCRLDKSRTWANRMMMELEYHDIAYFLTLTYNDDNVPLVYYQTDDDGVVDTAYKAGTLVPKHLQDFIKRLRDQQSYHHNRRIMYYACGEYGSETHRPHYHLTVYDVFFDDLEPLGKSKDGFQYYVSPTLERLWPYGYSMICNVTWETCAYIARYVTKKQYGKNAEFYDTFNIIPEFSRMSLKPSIGLRYYEDHKDEIYKYDEIHLSMPQRAINSKPPAYFDRKYDLEYPERLKEIKEAREHLATVQVKNILRDKYSEYTDFLRNQELYKERSFKQLKRSGVK